MSKLLAEKRWHKVSIIVWYMQMVPFLRFVSVTGSLAYDVAKPSSDIDIFIIAKAGRIWTCRAFARFFLKLIGQLRTGNLPRERAGKICPNRFVTDKYLVVNPQNSYHAQDYTQMVPLFDLENLYQKFVIANKWMEKFGYFRPRRALNLVDSVTPSFLRKFLELILGGKFGDYIEKKYQQSQLKEIKLEEPTVNKSGSTIIANDNEIRIHPAART